MKLKKNKSCLHFFDIFIYFRWKNYTRKYTRKYFNFYLKILTKKKNILLAHLWIQSLKVINTIEFHISNNSIIINQWLISIWKKIVNCTDVLKFCSFFNFFNHFFMCVFPNVPLKKEKSLHGLESLECAMVWGMTACSPFQNSLPLFTIFMYIQGKFNKGDILRCVKRK